MDDTNPPRRTEAEILADLAVSEAEIEAGRLTVPADQVLADLDVVIARLKLKTPTGGDPVCPTGNPSHR